MNPDVTQILNAAARGDRQAAGELLPLVYDELRRLAAAKMSHEAGGQTLQATALVHEAYMRLVGSGDDEQRWDNRRHFFAAAAESMRRILVENARRKLRLKHGGEHNRVELNEELMAIGEPAEDLLGVDDALDKLAEIDAPAAELVKLHYFAGLTLEQAADVLGISARSAYRTWSFARAWLYRFLSGDGSSSN